MILAQVDIMDDDTTLASSESEGFDNPSRPNTPVPPTQRKIRYLTANESPVVSVRCGQKDQTMDMDTIPSSQSFEEEPILAQHRRKGFCNHCQLFCMRGTSRVSGLVGVGGTLFLSVLLFLTLTTNRLYRQQEQQGTLNTSIVLWNFERPDCLSFRKRRKDGNHNEFKILQIADIHLGEAPDLDWGPLQDLHTWQALDAVLTAEAPIDLIVLSGDQLTANNCKDNATAYYQQLGDFLMTYGIPWALIFGNHDDSDYETSDGQRFPPKYVREDLLAIDQSFPLSLTRAGGPESIHGSTNYVLDIYHPDIGGSPFLGCQSRNTVAAQVFLMDSGGGTMEQAITDAQVEWVRGQINQSTVPAVAFQHIPTKSHAFVGENVCQGLHDDGVDAVDYDGGIMETLSSSRRFCFLAVGHNHGNDYCCPYSDSFRNESTMHVCFGRHSGYGGYGKWDRGCRVYLLEYDDIDGTRSLVDESTPPPSSAAAEVFNVESTSNMRWSSWVRLESGDVIDRLDV